MVGGVRWCMLVCVLQLWLPVCTGRLHAVVDSDPCGVLRGRGVVNAGHGCALCSTAHSWLCVAAEKN